MNRRDFLTGMSGTLVVSSRLYGQSAASGIDLKNSVVVVANNATAREKNAANVLIEEVEKRSQRQWKLQAGGGRVAGTSIYAGTRTSARAFGSRIASATKAAARLSPDGYTIQTGKDADGEWIAVIGADERGLLFGIGRLLYTAEFGRQSAQVDARRLAVTTAPKLGLRGHQLGYRPKTNAYDAWDVATWEQYIRDLAMFGTNAIELMPPRTDDEPDSPHFPLPPEQMMIEMSRICDRYGLDVWIWYPAMDPDYADAPTVEKALKEWAHIFRILPRIDAVFVPGGDPGHTEPKAMFAFLEKQKANLRQFHPKAQMWMSPQGFRESWMSDFFALMGQPRTATWLDGVVFGPQSRLSLPEFRKRLPAKFPVRFYPDITHSLSCQYPVPDWDVAFALTEGREVINPRPQDEANILRRSVSDTIGFLTYSEGCNDDVNKFVWSALGWDPEMHVMDALRNFSRYFFGHQYAEGVAQGLQNLEKNWRGPLATNEGVDVTLRRFQDLERFASPELLENWRFQQALYRAYFDAYLRTRLIGENGAIARAKSMLARINDIGWTPEPLGIGEAPSPAPPNSLDPSVVLQGAQRILEQAMLEPAGSPLRNRVRELGEALFQSIHMQLAVNRYRGEAVERAANLETLETPITDIGWLRAQIAVIGKLPSANEQVAAIRKLLERTDPGPDGFYDELGNLSNRPHLVLGAGSKEDPELRASVLTGFNYPDHLGDRAPMAWKCWAGSLYDAPLRMRYTDLDPEAAYRIRIVYNGGGRHIRVKLTANEKYEVHPLMERPSPQRPVEFDLPREATSTGELNLAWTREQGLGGNGRGCEVCEVWVMRKKS
jgi:hypothetical protein